MMILPRTPSGPSYRVWGHPVSVRGDVQRHPQQADTCDPRPAAPVRRCGSSSRARCSPRLTGRRYDTRRPCPESSPRSGRRRLRTRPGADSRRARASATHDPHPPRSCAPSWPRDRRRRVLVLREGAAHGLRTRVRAGTPLRARPCARAAAPAPERDGRVARVHPTLFDLIRRGRYKAAPATTERSVWGDCAARRWPISN
jgi:hypothetical protein